MLTTAIMKEKWINNKIDCFLLFSAFLLGFSLPVSIALTNIALVLALISLIIKHDFRQLHQAVTNPLFYLPLLMFLLLAVSLLYRDNPYGSAIIAKYRKLLYVLPVALFFLQDRRLAWISFKGFIVANIMVLVLSSMAWLNWLPIFNINPVNPTVFHLHITQNFFIAISCLAWLILACHRRGGWRFLYSALFVLGLCNVLFMVQGRIGYVALAVGLALWLWMTLKNRQKLFLVILGAVFIAAVCLVPNSAKDRMLNGINEVAQCVNAPAQQKESICDSSMGLRTEFVFKSIEIIKQHPILGAGAGGFAHHSQDMKYYHVNPHNEYLNQMVNTGLVGLMIFLIWTFMIYKAAFSLANPARNFMIAVVSIYMVGHLFNSFILDSIEGQMFMVIVAYLLATTITAKNEPGKKMALS